MAKMWLSDTTMYITTHNEISDTKTDIETNMLISYTSKYVTAHISTIWHYKVAYGTRCMNLPLQTMFTTQDVTIWQYKAW